MVGWSLTESAAVRASTLGCFTYCQACSAGPDLPALPILGTAKQQRTSSLHSHYSRAKSRRALQRQSVAAAKTLCARASLSASCQTEQEEAPDCSTSQGGLARDVSCEEAGEDVVAGNVSRRQVMAGLAAAAGVAGLPAQALADPSAVAAVNDGGVIAGGSAIEALRQRISSFTLSNGMRWVVLERHKAPILSCHIYADVGAANEAVGLTGVAHLLEHLAFKGTRRVGGRNPDKEEQLLQALDEVFYSLREAQDVGNSTRVRALTATFETLKAEADELVVPNEYGAILSRQGGVGLNAATSQDYTEYFVSLPANKLELWMALESGRFIAPVFRQLYSEKEVVKEERRMRVDNSPYGRFQEAFIRTAFGDLPYGRPVIGFPEDLEGLGRAEVETFFRQHYTPGNLTAAVVGDIEPMEVQRLAEKYFGGWQAAEESLSAPPPLLPLPATVSGVLTAPDRGWAALPKPGPDPELRMTLPANPVLLQGYFRPPGSSPDDAALSVLCDVLSGGRTSRFYRRLVLPGRVLGVDASESFPGDKYPTLLLLSGVPLPGQSTDDLAALIRQEVDYLVGKGASEDELLPAKKAARAGLLGAFGRNSSMARLLCEYEATTGNWSNLLEEPEVIQAVTPQDVQRVASQVFKPEHSVVGHVVRSKA